MSTDWPVNANNCDTKVGLCQESWHKLSTILANALDGRLESAGRLSAILTSYKREM
jgi:hypothetical protein